MNEAIRCDTEVRRKRDIVMWALSLPFVWLEGGLDLFGPPRPMPPKPEGWR